MQLHLPGWGWFMVRNCLHGEISLCLVKKKGSVEKLDADGENQIPKLTMKFIKRDLGSTIWNKKLGICFTDVITKAIIMHVPGSLLSSDCSTIVPVAFEFLSTRTCNEFLFLEKKKSVIHASISGTGYSLSLCPPKTSYSKMLQLEPIKKKTLEDIIEIKYSESEQTFAIVQPQIY